MDDGAESDIDAIYHLDAMSELDGEQLTRGREQLTEQIGDAIAYGNTYRRRARSFSEPKRSSFDTPWRA